MRTLVVIAVLTVALAGCGGSGRPAPPSASTSAPAPDAQRTQDLVALSTGQAARQAQRIALVVAGGSRVIEGAPGTPFTRTTFAVREVLKGRLPRRFVLQVVGGRLGDRVVASPVPAFAKFRHYLLFLGPDGPAGPTIFPQVVVGAGPRLNDVLLSIRRYLRTTGGSA